MPTLSTLDKFINTLDEQQLDSLIDIYADIDNDKLSTFELDDAMIDYICRTDINV